MPQRKGISQRAARALRKRVQELERERTALMRSWTGTYPGTHIDTIDVSEVESAILRTAIALKHPVVLVLGNGPRQFFVYAARGI